MGAGALSKSAKSDATGLLTPRLRPLTVPGVCENEGDNCGVNVGGSADGGRSTALISAGEPVSMSMGSGL